METTTQEEPTLKLANDLVFAALAVQSPTTSIFCGLNKVVGGNTVLTVKDEDGIKHSYEIVLNKTEEPSPAFEQEQQTQDASGGCKRQRCQGSQANDSTQQDASPQEEASPQRSCDGASGCKAQDA
jgi:hypothetical protein